jgi:hypothetical protein
LRHRLLLIQTGFFFLHVTWDIHDIFYVFLGTV